MKELKLLFVGNSFAVDTMEHTANIAHSLGIEKVKFGLLYVGGCSIDMHYEHATSDAAVYTYYVNEGEGWSNTPEYRIIDAVKSEAWDWIAIQHGTHGTSRYTSPECYEKLGDLIDLLLPWTTNRPKIAFNLTWMGESTRQHHEILSYGGNVALMRQKLEEVTREVILTKPKVDRLIPTGTAIENARTSRIGLLTRDCYHLSVDKGRFIAGLTFLCALADLDPETVSWTPEGVDDYARQVAVESAKNAIAAPLDITLSKL